ncbi:hypothetical protein FQA39_LY05946 [Lamprigera yunnana]|nr:hypothetical protein FQA39_LY05946 [Lamprigera yunnana]
MADSGSDKLPKGQQYVSGNEKDKLKENQDDRIIFPDELETMNQTKNRSGEPAGLKARNVISVGLKDGFERDAKGNPVKECGHGLLSFLLEVPIMSTSGSDKLPSGAQPPVGNEKDKIVFQENNSVDDNDRIIFEENDKVKQETPKEPPIPLFDRNTISVGLKQGYERDARGNPAPIWE